jgi:hypothetical protein
MRVYECPQTECEPCAECTTGSEKYVIHLADSDQEILLCRGCLKLLLTKIIEELT